MLDLDDTPDLVVIQVYITSASRAYRLADHYRRRGAYVVMGGLARHLAARRGRATFRHHLPGPGRGYLASISRGLPRGAGRTAVSFHGPDAGGPPALLDLIKRRLSLVPNSIVVSRGCPHSCDFCDKEAFFEED